MKKLSIIAVLLMTAFISFQAGRETGTRDVLNDPNMAQITGAAYSLGFCDGSKTEFCFMHLPYRHTGANGLPIVPMEDTQLHK